MGKHRRRDAPDQLATQQYDQLVAALRHHRPGRRSGLCLACGLGWPCPEVWRPLERGQMSGELE
jgi:hypothetical protein